MTIHIAPTDLRMLDAEPRVQDLRIAEALGFEKPLNIRKLIKRNTAELGQHGEVFSTVEKTSPSGGRPGEEFWLNEPQSVLICMFSRTDRAAEVRAEIVKVFMAWRRGHLADPSTGGPDPRVDLPVDEQQLQAYGLKLETVRLAWRVHGPSAAARLWKRLGLPPVEQSRIQETDDGRACLAWLLKFAVMDDRTVRMLIEAALGENDVEAQASSVLRDRFDIKTIEAEDGFAVANLGQGVAQIFRGSPWSDGRHIAALRRLPGTRTMKIRVGGFQRRATFVPAELMDLTEIPRAVSGNVVPLRS